MIFLNGILGVSATVFSIASGYGAYNNYLMNKEKYIKETISDSVEYSYITYVKDQKKEDLSDQNKKMAQKYAIDYFNDNCIYKVNDIRLNRMIKFRLLEIKSLKSAADKAEK